MGGGGVLFLGGGYKFLFGLLFLFLLVGWEVVNLKFLVVYFESFLVYCLLDRLVEIVLCINLCGCLFDF